MSELTNTRADCANFRWRLLTTVSALALLASVNMQDAKAADQDADRPTVWIELGGQLEQMSAAQEPFAPSFTASLPDTFFSPQSVQKPPRYSYGGEGSISFEPSGSDWVISASLRFGRSNGANHSHQQTPNAVVPYHFSTGKYEHGVFYPSSHVKFEDVIAKKSQTHAILDFQAGKDVGLGIFGSQSSSVLSAGIRFAQFISRTNTEMHMEPDVHYPSKPISSLPAWQAFRSAAIHFHDYAGLSDNERSFRGVGPSLVWNASASVLGNQERGEIALDWGANAAVLFGRQKMRGHHQTTVHSYYKHYWQKGFNSGGHFLTVSIAQHNQSANPNRTRSVVVPNFGGFAGFSFLYSNAKVSFGYRGDFFLGAMDGGIDAAKKENVGFYGPFASVSVGLGG